MTDGYRMCVARIHDHAQTCNPGWRRILDYVRKDQNRLTYDVLSRSQVDGLGPAELLMLSQDLWAFLGAHMTDDKMIARDVLAGGEDGNGFELWRILFWDHQGGAKQC